MTTSFSSRPVQTQILHVIGQRKHLRRRSLQLGADLDRDLHFDTLDVVDVILALEQHFHLTIPDDVGGRYSVFTPVGLLPAAVMGLDVRARDPGDPGV